jgi:multiple sugar transport system substrate-binding protein
MSAAAFVAVLAGCGGGSGTPTLNWYINPDNGGQKALAAKCTAAANGRYRIDTSLLPNDATQQREQLVRRLAAKDSSIDIMSLDPPFVPEFAEAGFLRTFSASEATDLTDGVLKGPVQSGTWRGKLMAAPFWANTQLLWYRKSVAAKTGVDPSVRPATWDQLINAAAQDGKTFQVQAKLYEGYMVWINALVASAGGEILQNPDAGKDVKPALNSGAGTQAARIIAELAHSRAADPGLATADEETARAGFQGANGGFMTNWPYVYGAAQEAVTAGSLPQTVLDDIGWARYPQAIAGVESRPPLGGINLGVGAFGHHRGFAVEAVRCITSPPSQREYMISAKNPAARGAVYDDPEVRKIFPMADLIRDSIDAGGPRPQSPYYTDVSAAVQRSFYPPSSASPTATPRRAASLIVDVLHDKVLL